MTNYTLIAVICALGLVSGGCVFGDALKPVGNSTKPGVVLEEFVFTEAPFPSCHAATIAEVKGELVCSFFGGTRERHPDVCIWISHKFNGQWTPVIKVADGIESPDQRYPTWNPVLFQPQDGDLQLYYKVGPAPSQWWGMMTTSADGGWNWTEPHALVDAEGQALIGPVKNKPIQLADGTILAGSSTEDHGWGIHVERSSDGGKTWVSSGTLNNPDEIGAIQPTLLTYPDGRIQMLCRTRYNENGYIAQSWSDDGGRTWSEMDATILPNNNSGIDGVTLADGRQLLVYNHSTRTQPGMGHKGRGIINVALSRDGIHWEAALVLDYEDRPNRQFSYPAVIQTADGLVHIVYTWHRERIKHVVLDPEKLQTVPMPDGKWPDSIKP